MNNVRGWWREDSLGHEKASFSWGEGGGDKEVAKHQVHISENCMYVGKETATI